MIPSFLINLTTSFKDGEIDFCSGTYFIGVPEHIYVEVSNGVDDNGLGISTIADIK